jgi:hypothetical protein
MCNSATRTVAGTPLVLCSMEDHSCCSPCILRHAGAHECQQPLRGVIQQCLGEHIPVRCLLLSSLIIMVSIDTDPKDTLVAACTLLLMQRDPKQLGTTCVEGRQGQRPRSIPLEPGAVGTIMSTEADEAVRQQVGAHGVALRLGPDVSAPRCHGCCFNLGILTRLDCNNGCPIAMLSPVSSGNVH